LSVPGDPDRSVAQRRRHVAAAGHLGDETTLREAGSDIDPGIRRLGLSGLDRMACLDADTLVGAFSDADATVRRRAAELAAGHPEVTLTPLLTDPDDRVVEMAAWAAGERGYHALDHEHLRRIGAGHADALCREAAVAALGAVGHPDGLATVLAAMDDIATVRRRAVVALAPFDGPEVTAALRGASEDRDWQVRQVAEDLLDL